MLKPDYEWVLVRMQIDCLAPADETCRYNTLDFRLVGDKQQIYSDFFEPRPQHQLNSGEMFGGGEITGDIVRQVWKDDTNLALIWNETFRGSRYMSLQH